MRIVHSHKNGAFTLIEFLVCVAVIAVIAAMIAGSTVRSKDQAHRIANVQRLRQLSVATLLYTEMYAVTPPVLTRDVTLHPQDALYNAGLVKDARLFASRFDPLEKGVANPDDPRFQSHFKISDLNPFYDAWGTLEFIKARNEPYGLFADISIGTRNHNAPVRQGLFYFVGTYNRALCDGSVVVRTQFPVEPTTGSLCLFRALYLTDMKPEEQQAYCREKQSP